MQHAFKFKPDNTDNQPAGDLPIAEYNFPGPGETPNGIVLVGEAPGAEEARQGHPFVGRSGQLLDKILDQAGIARKRCLVANSFRFRPPGNKIDHFFISRRAAKEQSIALAEQFGQFGSAFCRAEFSSELEHLGTTLTEYKKTCGGKIIVVALGRTALWALTGENGLMEKLGKPLPCRLLPGTSVIPTFHPSFILRGNWARQGEWLEHLTGAKNSLGV